MIVKVDTYNTLFHYLLSPRLCVHDKYVWSQIIAMQAVDDLILSWFHLRPLQAILNYIDRAWGPQLKKVVWWRLATCSRAVYAHRLQYQRRPGLFFTYTHTLSYTYTLTYSHKYTHFLHTYIRLYVVEG